MVINSAKEKFFFYYFPVALFSLIPFFLITGPFLSDLAISLISLLFLIYCFKQNNFSFFKNKYFYFFLIFWLYLIFNSLVKNPNLDSFKISFFYFRYGVFVIALVSLLSFDDKFIKYFFYSIFICFTVLIFHGFYEYFFVATNSRVSSFFGDEKILGSYLTRLWPIFFGLAILLFKRKEKLFFFLIIIFILSEALIFISGDRTAFFYINLSAVFVILFAQKIRKLRLLTLFSTILLLIIISFINPAAKERVFDETLVEMNLIDKDEKKETTEIFIFSKAHTHHYISAFRMFLDNKFLGVGIKNFRHFCSNEKYIKSDLSCATHPHNSYIQILTETGIIGFLFLLITLSYFLKYIFKHVVFKINNKSYFTDFEICILSGLAIYLWPFIPTGNFFSNWLNICMILNIPFLIWSRKSNNTKNTQ